MLSGETRMTNKIEQMLNKKFNRILVVNVSHQDKHGNYHFFCKCDCGKEFTTGGYKIRAGHTQSCGCLQQERTSEAKQKYKELVGKKFGRLTIMEQVEKQKNKHNQPTISFLCKCDCGKEKIIRHSYFLPGSRGTQSCGCLQKEVVSKARTKWKNKDLAHFASRFRNTVANALRKRNVKKQHKTEALLGCAVEELIRHVEGLFEPWMTWDNYGNKKGRWSLDHICPVSQAQTEEEVLLLQNFSNIMPLGHSENIRKFTSKTPLGEQLCKSLLGREWHHRSNTEEKSKWQS